MLCISQRELVLAFTIEGKRLRRGLPFLKEQEQRLISFMAFILFLYETTHSYSFYREEKSWTHEGLVANNINFVFPNSFSSSKIMCLISIYWIPFSTSQESSVEIIDSLSLNHAIKDFSDVRKATLLFSNLCTHCALTSTTDGEELYKHVVSGLAKWLKTHNIVSNIYFLATKTLRKYFRTWFFPFFNEKLSNIQLITSKWHRCLNFHCVQNIENYHSLKCALKMEKFVEVLSKWSEHL